MENNQEPMMINGEPVYPETNPIQEQETIPEPSLPYSVDSYEPPKPVEKGSDYGLAAMICGILGIMFMGLFPLSPGLGIAALVLAGKSTGEKDESYKTVGKITGIISIVLSVLMLLLFVGIVILAIVAGESV